MLPVGAFLYRTAPQQPIESKEERERIRVRVGNKNMSRSEGVRVREDEGEKVSRREEKRG
jgi:hypothetical protein